ncbi:MAG: hypothetical protein LBJ31_03115 [Treponema sp.]|nr:hypothetical protein [Treponema sp.]
MYGKKVWFFPDGDRPPPGDSALKGHESYIVLNPNNKDAHLVATFYFEEAEAVRNINLAVKAERVKCFQSHRNEDFDSHIVSPGIQYAVKIESDVPVIIQYGRLDARQKNLAYYTTMGYTEEK